jgi:hypothetical protein
MYQTRRSSMESVNIVESGVSVHAGSTYVIFAVAGYAHAYPMT